MTTFKDLADSSKVWIYQSDRAFDDRETSGIRSALRNFVQNWTSHGEQLYAFADVYFQNFIVIMVDQEVAKATGCAIDKSVAFIKEIERAFEVNLFKRTAIAYLDKDEIKTTTKRKFLNLIESGELTLDTIIFNNTVKKKSDFESKWKVKVKESWLMASV